MKYFLSLLIFILFSSQSFANQTSIPSSWKLYKDNTYQFKIAYPAKLPISNHFTTAYMLGSAWSTGSAIYKNNDRQHSILQIQLADISNQKDNAYYYQAFVRVGASDDPKDIKNCQTSNNAYLQQPFQKYEMINGLKFFTFNFSEASMSQLNSGISYRILHNHFCYAVEFVQTAGNIAAMPNYSKISKANQQLAKKIIASFKFMK